MVVSIGALVTVRFSLSEVVRFWEGQLIEVPLYKFIHMIVLRKTRHVGQIIIFQNSHLKAEN